MKFSLKRYMKTIKDFAYSFVAYALPTVALQFAIQPFIAAQLPAEENGLFLSLFNAIKLCVTVLVAALANARLLDKQSCKENRELEKSYNLLFVLVVTVALAAMAAFSLFYRGVNASAWDYLRLFLAAFLLCAHDFYAISFRVDINYKNILIDNVWILVGYAIGSFVFYKTGHWEYIFILGYTLGCAFVLRKTDMWKAGLSLKTMGDILPKYAPLCASSAMGSLTVYCDRLLIYPMIGGYAVSVYTAAAVVSKVISVVATPVLNVLLSYIVDRDGVSVKKQVLKKAIPITIGGGVVVYFGLYLASIILCKLLYPQYQAAAQQYVPIILAAVVLDTLAKVLNVVLLRFSARTVQMLKAAIKIGVYLGGVFLLVSGFQLGLLGFCLAILLADGINLMVVLFYFMKNITIK